MKKYHLLTLFIVFSAACVQAQCVIDRTDTSLFSPAPDSLPCIERTVAYNQIIQIHIPPSFNLEQFGLGFSYVLNVDSVVIDSVKGLPTGMSYTINPANGILYGDSNACATLS